ncbi:hypothetical protein LINGRAHAP2_LOCUS3284 [Linum grandiflorum]
MRMTAGEKITFFDPIYDWWEDHLGDQKHRRHHKNGNITSIMVRNTTTTMEPDTTTTNAGQHVDRLRSVHRHNKHSGADADYYYYYYQLHHVNKNRSKQHKRSRTWSVVQEK